MSLTQLTGGARSAGVDTGANYLYRSDDWLTCNYFHREDDSLRRALVLLATRSRENQLPNRHRALLKQQRTLLRPDLRTVSPTWVGSAYRCIRWSERPLG